MSGPDRYFRYVSPESRRRVCALAKVGETQDWPVEVADAPRVGEFLRLLREETDPDDRFALMELVLFSLDDVEDRHLWPEIEELLRASPEEYASCILYWSCLEEQEGRWTMPRARSRSFQLTPLARRVLVGVKDTIGFEELEVSPDALDEWEPLESFDVLDDPETSGYVEVTLHFSDGTERWCFFVTSEAIRDELQPVAGTRALYGMPHMIVVSELRPDTVAQLLAYLDDRGLLEACSLPRGEAAP